MTAHDPATGTSWAVIDRPYRSVKGSRPQSIGRSDRVLSLLAAAPQEVRPVRIGQAVVAGWKLSGFRGAVDSLEHAVASLLDQAQQRVDVPPNELALPKHDASRDE